MTIQSYEIRALDDFGGRIHWMPSDIGAWCPADSVRRLETDMEALRAELAALKEGPDYKGVLFALCASLSLEDTIGDVWEDVIEALDQAGICADIGSMDGFQDVLKIMPKPVMTLYGPIEEDE